MVQAQVEQKRPGRRSKDQPTSCGRPREHDREQIGKDLIEWSKREDSINLNAFCFENMITPEKLCLWAKDDDVFRQAFQLAKSCLGAKRERLLNTGKLHNRAYEANKSVYDYFIKKDKMEEMEYEAKLKTQSDVAVGEAFAEKHESLLQQFKSMQVDKKKAAD
jgi:hypothetical protein